MIYLFIFLLHTSVSLSLPTAAVESFVGHSSSITGLNSLNFLRSTLHSALPLHHLPSLLHILFSLSSSSCPFFFFLSAHLVPVAAPSPRLSPQRMLFPSSILQRLAPPYHSVIRRHTQGAHVPPPREGHGASLAFLVSCIVHTPSAGDTGGPESAKHCTHSKEEENNIVFDAWNEGEDPPKPSPPPPANVSIPKHQTNAT